MIQYATSDMLDIFVDYLQAIFDTEEGDCLYSLLFETYYVISNLVVESKQEIDNILDTTSSLLNDTERVKELVQLTMKTLEMRNLTKDVVPYLWEMLDVLVGSHKDVLEFFRESQGEDLVEHWSDSPN